MQITKTKTDILIDGTIDEVKLHANYLRLYTDNIIIADIPYEQINSIIIIGSNTSISGRLIKVCSQRQIPLHIITEQFKHYGSIYFAVHNNIKNRILQYKVLIHDKWCIYLSKQLIYSKILTQKNFLERVNDSSSLNKYLDKVKDKKSLNSLLGLEGVSASIYWQSFTQLIPDHILREFRWKGRIKNPCLDPINSMLSLGYGLLSTQCQSSLTINGLDPYLGILHVVSEDRPALVYDIMEIYRVLLVDSWVLSLINNKIFKPEDFTFTKEGVCTLKIDKKNEFFSLWYRRLKHYEFSTTMGKLTIHQFLELNTLELINWLKKIHNNKIRDTGKTDLLTQNLITFTNPDEFAQI